MNNIEIERKWLMEGYPDLKEKKEIDMEQGYLTLNPMVRIRKSTFGNQVNYKLCIKSKGTLKRTEVEVDLTGGQYDALVQLLPIPPVRKKLRLYNIEGTNYTLECSLVDEGNPTAFYYAEVEFEDVQAAKNFVPMAYLGKEVTEIPGYTMSDYYKSKMEKNR